MAPLSLLLCCGSLVSWPCLFEGGAQAGLCPLTKYGSCFLAATTYQRDLEEATFLRPLLMSGNDRAEPTQHLQSLSASALPKLHASKTQFAVPQPPAPLRGLGDPAANARRPGPHLASNLSVHCKRWIRSSSSAQGPPGAICGVSRAGSETAPLPLPVLFIKFYWHTATPICLHISFVCSQATRIDGSMIGCDIMTWSAEAKIVIF
jgi:hypothetical protein